MADTLEDLYTKSPGTAQVASTAPATSSNATAQQAQSGLLSQASNYTANTQNVNDADLTSSRLNKITSQDSPIMQRARQEGMLLAARRGLQNSSIAAGASEGAVVDRATPIAQQESSLLQNQQLANQNATNTASQFNAATDTQNSQFNTGQQNDISKTNASLGTDVSKLNAQNATDTSRFNAETAAQSAQQNAQAENAMRTSVMNQNAELNKQYLQGTQSLDLASLQGKYQALIQSNAAAASLYNTYFQTISQVMSNTNMDPARAAQIVGSLQTTLAGGLDFMNAMSGLDGAPATGAGGTPYTPPPSAGTGAASGGTGIPYPTGSGTNVHLPVTPTHGTQSFNSAGGEAANTSSVPAGAEASAYGGLLSKAGSLATGASGTSLAQNLGASGTLSAAGSLASGAGGALGLVGGLEEGGVSGYARAVQSAGQLAGQLGLVDTGVASAGAAGGAGLAGGASSGGGISGVVGLYNGIKGLLGPDQGKFAGTASAAAAGMQVAGPWGALVGAALGYLKEGGAKDSVPYDAAGFSGTTMDKAWQDQNIARLASNPAASVASKLGVKSDSVLGTILDPSNLFSKHGDEKRNIKAFTSAIPLSDAGNGQFALSDGTKISKDKLQALAGAWYGATYAPDGDQKGWQMKYIKQLYDVYGTNLPPAELLKLPPLPKQNTPTAGGSKGPAAVKLQR